MVAPRRFGPLIAALFVGLFVLLVRLVQVQWAEHELWANEASGMVRTSNLVPCQRGEITDRNGCVLARDETAWEIVFRYRDFRRENALAQVAHARSALERRAVPLSEAWQHLDDWANELVSLSPANVAALGAQRAADLRFYAQGLLAVDEGERSTLRPRAKSPEEQLSFLELVARGRHADPAQLRRELGARLVRTREHLALLAQSLAREPGTLIKDPTAEPLAQLFDALEAQRRRVEDTAADALFAVAAGFAPGRIEPRWLSTRFDLGWLGDMLDWDSARLSEWAAGRREIWLHAFEESLLPRVLAHAATEEIPERRADRLLSELAALYLRPDDGTRRPGEPPPSWRELGETVVQAELDELFLLPRAPRGWQRQRTWLPFHDSAARELAVQLDQRWMTVAVIGELARDTAFDAGYADPRDPSFTPPRGSNDAEQRWRMLGKGPHRLESDAALAELRWLAFSVENRFQAALGRELDGLFAALAEGDVLPAKLGFKSERIDQAAQQQRFLVREQGARELLLVKDPSYAFVHMVERFPSDCAGFLARPTTRRVDPERDPYGRPLAPLLIGSVHRPTLADLFGQSRDLRRLGVLRGQLLKSRTDESEMREIKTRLFQNDEWTGGSGIEDYFDRELRGRSGIFERQGLAQEEQARTRVSERAAENGRALGLTLDVPCQRAAQETLEHPLMPPGPASDQLWCQYPIGAIVLATVDGDVLAAASVPSVDHLPKTPGRDEERAHLRERTLKRPTFNPPGSVFKPFAAAYALDKLGFDPQTLYTCGMLPDGKSGYSVLHCHGHHDQLRLRAALAVSCNAYFAQLGEHLYTPASFVDMLHVWGFGEPTGVRSFGGEGRSGLSEDAELARVADLPHGLEDPHNRMRFACGLGLIEATPMQVARAMAGLVTGTLPQMRLVHSIDGQELARKSRPLAISSSALEFVRAAMDDVVNVRGGTAYEKGLDPASLGFRFACKTGSADIHTFEDTPELTAADRDDMLAGKWRKHAWIGGFFPEIDPKYVLVVYLHDVSETANNTAVYIAAQFLKSEAVQHLVSDPTVKGSK